MKKEYRYIGAILSIFILSMAILLALLRKYSLLTFQHFVDTCRQILPGFLSSGVHFVGLALIALTILVSVVFFAKTIFSLIKTQKKIHSLLKYRSKIIPGKLSKILEKYDLENHSVVVINKNESYAFNYGFRHQRILVSEGLIGNLSHKELEAVILHEKYHLNNKHIFLLILSEIISSSVFFLPLAKEINKSMRVMFEKQADNFAESIQGSSFHLNAALLKVPSSRVKFYPNFAVRRSHKMPKSSVVLSLFAGLLALSLFIFPIRIHASESVPLPITENCNQIQCTVNCLMSQAQ